MLNNLRVSAVARCLQRECVGVMSSVVLFPVLQRPLSDSFMSESPLQHFVEHLGCSTKPLLDKEAFHILLEIHESVHGTMRWVVHAKDSSEQDVEGEGGRREAICRTVGVHL